MGGQHTLSGETRSRASLMRHVLLVGGGVAAGAVAGATVVERAFSAPSPEQDAQILNLVLGLEYLEEAFYADAIKRGALGGELLEFANVVGGHEQEHVAYVRGALGTHAAKRPRFAFGQATASPKAFVRNAVALEDTMVGAYNGQATNLTPARSQPPRASLSVEARHAAWIRDIAGVTPPRTRPTRR